MDGEVQRIDLVTAVFIQMGERVDARAVIFRAVPGVAVVGYHNSVGVRREVDRQMQRHGGVAAVERLELLQVVTGLAQVRKGQGEPYETQERGCKCRPALQRILKRLNSL